ncbi:ComEA family DNA-binding protein [Rhodococcus phenolicus]|uniref:ComEA family DNA-binding protein n=1 Tax=Rhodococcus phenolicus TaxID=263849 RepID=UPI00082EA514|nr:ComEA family DNA-binding protein [Rhodococcus phenolicus]
MGSGDDGERVRSRLDAIARAAGDYGEESPAGGGRADRDDGYGPADEPEPLRLSDRLRAARWQTGRGGTAALGVVGVVAALVAFVVVWRDQPVPQAVPPLPSVSAVSEPPGSEPPGSEPPGSEPSGGASVSETTEPEELVVSVVGLVGAPGLVTLAPGTRVADALTAAGGALPGADLAGINLAQRVADGDQIVVGAVPPDPPPPASSVSSAGTGAGSPAPAAESGAGPVNLNTADEAALDALPGVGPVTAAAIIAWRDENGPFTDVEQLGEVDGIGPARLARLRTVVTV